MSNTDFNHEDLIPEEEDRPASRPQKDADQPLYRIYAGSKLPVGKAVGPMWDKRIQAAITAQDSVLTVWEECFRYYNFHHRMELQTDRGTFRRGDGTENVIHSNVNITLPAVYSKNPDISCTTVDGDDEPFCQALQALLNQLLRREDQLNAKSKAKRATGLALLTNFGVLKIDFTKKDDSREFVLSELQKKNGELAKATKQEDVKRIYGEMQALEQNMEVRKPSGFEMSNVLPHNLIVDPYAEQPDASDADWMAERVYIDTDELNARYTMEGKGDQEGSRVLVYKPTHQAVGTDSTTSDGGTNMVLSALSSEGETGGNTQVLSHTTDERRAYIGQFYSECYMVWDKIFRRVYLFHRDDFTWPLWVWDDTLKTTRFFPYFPISFAFSTGGIVNVGDVAFVLDQQDHINDINRQATRIRRAIFDYVFYNKDRVDKDTIESFVKALRGDTSQTSHAIAVSAGDMKVSDCVEAFAPPAEKYKELFDKESLYEGINRQTNTSDALRGVQFKTNTNVEAVNTYQQSMMLSVGAKVDCVEDCMTMLCRSVAEIAVQNWDNGIVEGFIGKKLAQGWQQMDLDTFRATYTLEITPGSMEKPTSVFKKKEALEITKAVGQFAAAAPGATLMIMLKVLSKAYTDINIRQEDWDALWQEIQANLSRGDSTGGAAGGQPAQQPGQQQGGGQDQAGLEQAVNSLPPDAKQRIMQAGQRGASDDELRHMIEGELAKAGHGQSQQGQPQPQPQQQVNQQPPPKQPQRPQKTAGVR